MLNSKSPLVMPRATPAPKASGRLSMPAMMAAASAGRMSVGPAPAAMVMPAEGVLRMLVRPANKPAITQTRVESRRTGMPSSRARSELSATERTATPASVRRRNQPRATSTRGTTMAMRRSFPLKSTGKIRTCCALSGVVTPPTMEGPPSQPGTSSWIPPKSCANPMVTTITISRGAVKKRQRMTKSTKRPSAAPTKRAIPMQTNQLTWWARFSSTATVAASAPMAP